MITIAHFLSTTISLWHACIVLPITIRQDKCLKYDKLSFGCCISNQHPSCWTTIPSPTLFFFFFPMKQFHYCCGITRKCILFSFSLAAFFNSVLSHFLLLVMQYVSRNEISAFITFFYKKLKLEMVYKTWSPSIIFKRRSS